MKKIDVELRGSTGYVGEELLGVLESHPGVGRIDCVQAEDEPSERAETSFLALPPGLSGEVAGHLVKAGKMVIDLSGDLRFEDPKQYEKWYQKPHPAPNLLPVVYGLPEMNRDEIRGSWIVSVPGCYPTATLLGLLPLIENGLLEPDKSLIVTAFSGYSGAGKKGPGGETDDQVLYSMGRDHRHVGEMEQFTGNNNINFMATRSDNIFRGLLSTIGAVLRNGVEAGDVREAFVQKYADEPFVKMLEDGEKLSQTYAADTDLCAILQKITVGRDTDITALLASNIDNLRKGSATQAIQCFNLMHAFDETTGLTPKSAAS